MASQNQRGGHERPGRGDRGPRIDKHGLRAPPQMRGVSQRHSVKSGFDDMLEAASTVSRDNGGHGHHSGYRNQH